MGQLFIFGFSGQAYDTHLDSLIRDLRPGGVVVFGRNILNARQVVSLNRSLQRAAITASGVPLLIALDQEGGDVSRIRLSPPIPSALALGQTRDETLAERMGYLIGSVLAPLGFNMNLAPVLDLSDPNSRSFIGTRSFGGNPQLVSQMASAYALGLTQAGVLSTGKHFPGHGNVLSDSHKDLPTKEESLTQMISSDLRPFSLFMKNVKAPAIMVAHVAYPMIDPSRTPATFSKPILSGILRNQLQYQGLVITDDIEMAATHGVGNFEERAIRAIEAGADLVMVAWSREAQRKAVAAVLRAVKERRIPEEIIERAVRRILTTKYNYSSLRSAPLPNIETFRQIVKSNSLRDLTDLILDKNFFRSMNGLSEKSFVRTRNPVYIISTKSDFFESFHNSSLLQSIWVPYRTNDPDLQKTLDQNPNSYAVLYLVGPRTASFANNLPRAIKQRLLIINATVPGIVRHVDDFLGVLNIYSRHPGAGRLAAENLIRPAPPKQRLKDTKNRTR